MRGLLLHSAVEECPTTTSYRSCLIHLHHSVGRTDGRTDGGVQCVVAPPRGGRLVDAENCRCRRHSTDSRSFCACVNVRCGVCLLVCWLPRTCVCLSVCLSFPHLLRGRCVCNLSISQPTIASTTHHATRGPMHPRARAIALAYCCARA